MTTAQRATQATGNTNKPKRLMLSGGKTGLTISVIAIAILLLLVAFLSLVFVKADITLGAPFTSPLYYDSVSGSISKPVRKLGPWYVVKRNQPTIIFSSDSGESIVNVNQSSAGFIYSHWRIDFVDSLKATKLASGVQPCPIVIDRVVYSYSCSSPKTIEKTTADSRGYPVHEVVKTISGPSNSVNVAWYQGAALLLTAQKNASGATSYSLELIHQDNKPLTSSLPGGFISDKDYVRIYTSTASVSESGFVAYNVSTGTGYYYTNFADTKPIRFTRQATFNIETQTHSCTLVAKLFSCYYGTTGYDSEHVGRGISNSTVSQVPTSEPGVLEIINFDDGTPTINDYAGSKYYGLSRLLSTTDHKLYGIHGKAVDQLTINDRKHIFNHRPIVNNSSAVTAHDNLLYVQGSRLLSYDAKANTSRLLYDVDEDLESIVVHGEQLLITSTNPRDPVNLLNVFQLK